METGLVAISCIAAINGGWMFVDGLRALLTGRYITPGHRPGELGPWRVLVRRLGLDPLSAPVRMTILLIGATWWLALVLFHRGDDPNLVVMHVAALCTLWYLPLGTLLSVACLVLMHL